MDLLEKEGGNGLSHVKMGRGQAQVPGVVLSLVCAHKMSHVCNSKRFKE